MGHRHLVANPRLRGASIRAVGLGLAAGVVIAISGCQGSAGDDSTTETMPPVSAGAYCGLVSTDLAESLLGEDVTVTGDLVTSTPGAGSLECKIRGDSDGPSAITVVVVTDPGQPTPQVVNTDGCTPVTVEGWGPVTSCPSDSSITLPAYPPTQGRFIRVTMRLDEPGAQLEATAAQLQEMTDAAVAVAEDVNSRLDSL